MSDAVTRATGLRSARRWRIACGFCAVVTFTVIAGYYVPLYREARRLRAESVQSAKDRAALRVSLERAHSQLSENQTEQAKLTASLDAEQSLARDIQQRIERLKQSLATQFSRLARAKMLSISSAQDRVSIAVVMSALFAPGRPEVTPEGRSLLCKLARAVLAEHGGEIRVTGYYGKPSVEGRTLRAIPSTPWAVSAARAASAVDVLEKSCGAPTARLLAVAYGPRAAGPLGENVALEFVFQSED